MPFDAEGSDFIDEVYVPNEHPSTAIPFEAQIVERLTSVLSIVHGLAELLIFVGNYLATTPASDGNNHFSHLPIRLLPLLSGTASHLMLGFLTPWIIDKYLLLKTYKLVPKFLVFALCAIIVFD